eukprot:1201685-Prymnesium_polylepis.1
MVRSVRVVRKQLERLRKLGVKPEPQQSWTAGRLATQDALRGGQSHRYSTPRHQALTLALLSRRPTSRSNRLPTSSISASSLRNTD